jgi:ADP-ribosylation factor protein 1
MFLFCSLQQIIDDPLMRHSVILVFANKQDLKNALTPAETCQAMGLTQLKSRKWHVQGAVATRGEGLYEGLDWLSSTLKTIQRSWWWRKRMADGWGKGGQMRWAGFCVH